MRNPEDEQLTFGKHQGSRLAAVPLGYLRWMVSKETQQHEAAEAEMERRGTPLPEIELTAHAIDRASQRCLSIWEGWKDYGAGDLAYLDTRHLAGPVNFRWLT